MRNNTYVELEIAKKGLVSAAEHLFRDRLTYGDNTKAVEERIAELVIEYSKIIDDYISDTALIKDEEEW